MWPVNMTGKRLTGQLTDQSGHFVDRLLFRAREVLEECCVIGPLHLESITWYKTTMQERKGHIREILFVLSQSIHRSQVCLASSCKLKGLFLGMLYFEEVVFFYCLLGEFFFWNNTKYRVEIFCKDILFCPHGLLSGYNHCFYCPVLVEPYSPVKFPLIELSF